jgi:hypothetical protein
MLGGNDFRRYRNAVGSRSDTFPSGERRNWVVLPHQDTPLLSSSVAFDPNAALAGAGSARSRVISEDFCGTPL